MTSPLIAFQPEDDNGRTIVYNILLNLYYYHLFTFFLNIFSCPSLHAKRIETAEQTEATLMIFPFTYSFGDELISITADVCEAFCLFRVFCGLIFSDFRAFRG